MDKVQQDLEKLEVTDWEERIQDQKKKKKNLMFTGQRYFQKALQSIHNGISN